MEQVFISYSRRDLEFVKRLSADLQAAGLKVWYDLSGLEAGTRWGIEIQDALDKSRYFLVVLSSNSCRSEWVEREFLYASNLGLKIVPILYEPCKLPLWSLNLHYLELGQQKYESGFPELCRLLGVKPPPKKEIKPVEKEKVSIPPAWEELVSTPLVPTEEPVGPAVEISTRENKASRQKLRKTKPEKSPREKVQKPPRPGARKALILGLGGTAGIILIALGIIYYGRDIKAALFPRIATETISSTQSLTKTFPPTASPEITSVATPPIDSDGVRLADGMQMVYVPEGEFTMGSDEGESNEQPTHQVYLDAYWIDQTEVSNAMYGLCVSKGVCQWSSSYKSYTQRYWDSPILLSDRPVIYVDWNSAKTYCAWVGGRLPTEAEWEKAARGTDGRIYPWGDDDPTCLMANFTSGDCGYNNPTGVFVYTSDDPTCLPGPVTTRGDCLGSYESIYSFPSGASPYKALNLAGGVWEWVADWFGEYPATLVRNPTGPSTGEERILRGGAWTSSADNIRTTFRYASSPGSMSYTIGFRCVVDASDTVSTVEAAPPTAAAIPTAVAAFLSPTDGMPMVRVPEGEFTMGSDEYEDTQPVHTVYLDEFWIDQTEVTNDMYQLCVGAGECDMPDRIDISSGDYYGNFRYDNYPVLHLTWNNAQAYCQWAGRRLPTEAEWEKAARGTDARTYPWGEETPTCSLANFMVGFGGGCDGIFFTHAVGLLPAGASPYGVYDMAGNVSEWVADWYSETYYGESSYDNPIGPSSGVYRVLRGGSFEGIRYSVKTFYRNWIDPTNNNANLGFRCAMDAEP